MCQVCFEAATDSGHSSFCQCGSPATLAAMRRIEADISRRQMLGGMSAVVGMFAGFGLAPQDVQAQTPGAPILLTNLRLFDGETLAMREGVEILIEGERITALPPVGQGPQDAQRIDCGGRAVIPGLIDAHWHATLVGVSQIAALTQDIGFVHLMAGREAGATLMRGFTTVRDMGGPAFGLKLAIDKGAVTGPRIFPSGAMISQTGGHGDFRLLSDLPRFPDTPPGNIERQGVALIADGVDAVLRATREQLMKGASQIKIMAGGGVSSLYDPLDGVQYTEAEMRAAVEAATDWGTYVSAHVYTPGGIQRAVRAGVKSIEHGQLADEESVVMMAGEGAWWSIQPFLADEDSNPKPDPIQQAKQAQVFQGTVRAFELAKKHGALLAFGTDILFNPAGTASQGRQLAKFARFMSPLEALHKATGAAGSLLALSGTRAPYDGRLGVIAEGALADLLVIDGDPATDLAWLDTPDASLRVIIKGGRMFKNIL
ncbi:MAG TPA: amidohydrolase family protein [Paracoccus solventivorans]|uniref:Amidohydrolase family protein n=2 Tax=Paracoccus solventivorans TaxID=53463 RepID=A0A832PK07_9RHOB|nr:amidohydrolase family protein [Paracoccus solventivorans]